MPIPPSQEGLPPGVRSRLWVRGDWLGLRNEGWYLWLHLNDGRVFGFYLSEGVGADDQALEELVEPVAADPRGTLLEVRLGEGVAVPLYAAPAVPLPRLPRAGPWHRAAQGLDQEVLSLLAGLNGHRHWDSLRNYNRLACHLIRRNENADLWERVEFAISQVPAP